jgi:hypothetical protein
MHVELPDAKPPPRNERPRCPLPTPADVASLIMPEGYAQKRAAMMPAALLAAAACARVNKWQAVRIRIGEHWSPDRPELLVVPDRHWPRPAYLLPIVQFAFLRICEFHGKTDGMHLFATGKELKTDSDFGHRLRVLRQTLTRLGDRRRLNTERIVTRMHDFFDMYIPPGTPDEMVLALSGRKSRKNLGDPEYGVPIAKLRRFLEVNHPLAGPAGAYTGTRGKNWIASQPRNLLAPKRFINYPTSVAYDTDPILLEMREVPWPEDEQEWDDFRLDMRDRYFPHIHSLREAGKLYRREELSLFRATERPETVRSWHRMRIVSDPLERPREELKLIFLDGFTDRLPGETPYALWHRIATRERCWINHSLVHRWWLDAGLIRRQRRGRPRKMSLVRPRRKPE